MRAHSLPAAAPARLASRAARALPGGARAGGRARACGSATSTNTSISGKLASLAGLGLPTSTVYVRLPARRASVRTAATASR